MAAQRGFCPYCSYVNPPDYKFCVSCKKRLPEYPVPPSNATGLVDDGVPTEPEEPPPPKSARWVILVLTIGVALVVLVASYLVLTHVLVGTPGGNSPSSKGTTLVDICDASAGVDCKGNRVQLPYLVNQLTENVSACVQIVPQAGPSKLLLNFTTTSKVYGALIPESFDKESVTSYSVDPAGFYNNSSAISQSAWASGALLGAESVNPGIPDISATWCLVWWDPGPAATITLTADAYLAYG